MGDNVGYASWTKNSSSFHPTPFEHHHNTTTPDLHCQKQKSLNCWGDFAACPKMHAKRNSEVDGTNPEIILLMPFSFIRFSKAMPPRRLLSSTVPCPCLVFGIPGSRRDSARLIYRFFVPVTLYWLTYQYPLTIHVPASMRRPNADFLLLNEFLNLDIFHPRSEMHPLTWMTDPDYFLGRIAINFWPAKSNTIFVCHWVYVCVNS